LTGILCIVFNNLKYFIAVFCYDKKTLQEDLSGASDGGNELSPVARHALPDQHRNLCAFSVTIKTLQQQIEQFLAAHPAFARLQVLPGIGPDLLTL